MFILGQFGISQNLQMSPISKTSQDQFLGLDFSYSKTTLVWFCWFGSEGTQVKLEFRKFQKQIVHLI